MRSLPIVLPLLLAAACGSLTAGTYQDALGRWRMGDTSGAIAAARARYEAYRADNDLQQAAVEEAARAAFQTLDEVPVLPRGEKAGGVEPVKAVDSGDDALSRAIREDLTSGRATAVMRALASVRDLALKDQAMWVLAVVYRRAPIEDDGGVLQGLSTALRSVATKWGAIQTLEALSQARPKPAPGPK